VCWVICLLAGALLAAGCGTEEGDPSGPALSKSESWRSDGGSRSSDGGSGSFDGGSGSFDGGSGTNFARPLSIPPVLAPTSSDATTDFYNIEMRTGTAQIRNSGSGTPIWGYNGLFPGPTIVATKGRPVQVTQRNSLSENMTVHNHGHKAAASSDGHPTDYIFPGASKTYYYPNDQRASTYWYHDHTMDLTGPHINNGLAAYYIIRDPAEDSLNLPSGSYDVPLLIQDRKFVFGSNNLSYDAQDNLDREGFLGDVAVVNGIETPYFEVANRKYRFRVLNGSNAREYNLVVRLSGSFSNRSFQVIGSDGGLLTGPVTVTSLRIAPAERYDIVISFAGLGVGTNLVLQNTDSTRPEITDLMQFRVTRSESDPSVVPATLSSITRLDRSQSAGTFDIVFDSDRNDWTLNGKLYDPARIDVTSHLNTVYIWRLINRSRQMHPFHKHLTQFNVLTLNGSNPPAIKNGWKDTIAVDSDATVEIIFKDETFSGIYVFHCHRLEHEDHRMMLQEETVP
jgi:spore coat protein A